MADIDVAQNNVAAAIPEWEAAVRLDRNDKAIAFYWDALGHNARHSAAWRGK